MKTLKKRILMKASELPRLFSISFCFSFPFRYLRALQNLDLTNGFYFSYTYDLTHTLQYNLTQRNQPESEEMNEDLCWGTRYQPTWKFVWNEYLQAPLRSQVHSRWLIFLMHGK